MRPRRDHRLGGTPSEVRKRSRLNEARDVFALQRVVAGHHAGDIAIRSGADIREGAGDLIGGARLTRRTGGQRPGDHDPGRVSLIGHDPAPGFHHTREMFTGKVFCRHHIPTGAVDLGDPDPTGEIGRGPTGGGCPHVVATPGRDPAGFGACGRCRPDTGVGCLAATGLTRVNAIPRRNHIAPRWPRLAGDRRHLIDRRVVSAAPPGIATPTP